MKNLFEKIINLLPYFVLILLLGSVPFFVSIKDLEYEQYLGILKALIWPSVVLMSLLFFRKVFTYLFFSISEFNFFGAKGSLRDIEEVINERVEERVLEKENQAKRAREIETVSSAIERFKLTGELIPNTKELVEKATVLIKKYDELSIEHEETVKELNEFRRRQEGREARTAYLRERMKQKIEEYRQRENGPSLGNEVKGTVR